MESVVRQFLCVLVIALATVRAQDRDYWMEEGHKSLLEAIKLRPNTGVAKNVILFLGDGMGVSTITAGRILKGQIDGGTGEEYRLQMEKLPYSGLIKTYNTNQQTPDSAGTATAFMTGVKTRAGVLGVDNTVVQGNCSQLPNAALDSLVDWALKEGKSVGLVTTTRITHATPGAGYAKTPHRDWENDADMKDVTGCGHVPDIARQLVENYSEIQVLMGGGRNNFFSKVGGGKREDGRDLIKEWKRKQKEKNRKFQYVETNDQLKEIPKDTESLFGLFNPSHMTWDSHRKETGKDSEPSISQMFETAHRLLRKNDKGYFLLVEGGRIDHAHHKNLAHQSLLETVAFDKAITSAVKLTSEADTLLMVTADHSHTFTIAGYPARGHNIVDKITYDNVPPAKSTGDGYPMSTLMYANGPGPQRTNLTGVNTTGVDFVFPNGVPLESETHGGEDVAVFARGPMSHLVGGVHEQNVLAHIMGYASCIGPDKSHCQGDVISKFCPSDNSSSGNFHAAWINVIIGLVVALFVVRR